jgi:hypothetical protein
MRREWWRRSEARQRGNLLRSRKQREAVNQMGLRMHFPKKKGWLEAQTKRTRDGKAGGARTSSSPHLSLTKDAQVTEPEYKKMK